MLGAGGLALGADGFLYEPNHPVTNSREIVLPRLPERLDGFRIVQLSDFHYDPHFSAVPIRKSVAMVNALHPDAIVLTGDFVTVPALADKGSSRAKHAADAAEPCVALLEGLRAPYGVWASLGNHDAFSDPERVVEVLQSRGIRVLRNSCAALERDGSRLWLSGLDDVLEGDPDMGAALRGIPANEPVVMLVHEPDFAPETARYPVDLQLSGHSHGGQVRVPLVGALVLPRMGRRYPMGQYQIQKLALYTNVGLGTIRIAIRLDCAPEITHITLRRARS